MNSEKNRSSLIALLLPLSLCLFIVIADQLTKILIVGNLPNIGDSVNIFGDFIRFVHVRNTNAAFGMGKGLAQPWHFIFTAILPVILLCALLVYYFLGKGISRAQRWLFAAVLGGGFGNVIDKIIRPEGVVDFVTVKLYGLFGLQYWPSFNVADSAIVVSMILLLVFVMIEEAAKKSRKEVK
ncbi:MAG: signal peptidase II [Spirochaetales bacterium]|nr:signal peptidase II [Spirochaetales bacterium]